MEPSTLVKIREDLKSVSGVYAFKSNMSNKVYVGSSINLAGRAMDHIKNQNSNIYLQNAITKYGLNKFSFFVLEFLPQDCTSYDDLLDLEQKYLNLFKDKYNFENFAKKSRAGYRSTEESKKLMSQKKKEYYTEDRKKLVSEQFRKELFLYDANTLN
uniref:GIY-YIG domain-containing protein n=1 Tax=Orbilia brochopaga TaxID=3140254 RepID=A0A4Y5MZP1_9PEZI|nr:hypothetical protein [Drechslerella brochopaga]